MTLEGDRTEKRNFGDIDSAVEFITHRPHENFTIYNTTQDVIDRIREQVANVITKGD